MTTTTKIRVTLDGEFTCDALDKGERWNGFVVPYLTEDAIGDWAEWTAAEDDEWDGGEVEVVDGVLTVWQEGEVTDRVLRCEDGTYRFDLGLIWTEAV